LDELRLDKIGAVVLAAGLSSRMGRAKQLLPWGERLMVRHVVDTLVAGGADVGAVAVVVGHQADEVTAALQGSAAISVINPLYHDGSMLRSLQVGLAALTALAVPLGAALVALGDQPQVDIAIVRRVIAHWRSIGGNLVAPSFNHKRGHPILFARPVWQSVLAAQPVGSPREWLADRADQIAYLEIGDDAVLRDIDTPADYERELARRV
jgi:molybdenum cofactor cytidylyltransferase